jgi:CRISPR-associated protein Cmr4
MAATFYLITAQTNIHPGSGDVNYGIIDKLVQRDALTDLPCIYSQSVKGSLREHFEGLNQFDGGFMDVVFGKTNKKNGKTKIMDKDEGKSGDFIFMQANLLSIPIRSNDKPYYEVTSVGILKDLAATMVQTGFKKSDDELITKLKAFTPNATISLNGRVKLEDKTVEIESLSNDLTSFSLNNIVILDDTTFKELTDNHHLPVIARNHLENGQSSNLWYEQILPRQTKFYVPIFQTNTEGSRFETEVQSAGKLIQIGANATVGYGYCSFKKIN